MLDEQPDSVSTSVVLPLMPIITLCASRNSHLHSKVITHITVETPKVKCSHRGNYEFPICFCPLDPFFRGSPSSPASLSYFFIDFWSPQIRNCMGVWTISAKKLACEHACVEIAIAHVNHPPPGGGGGGGSVCFFGKPSRRAIGMLF